MSQSRLLVRGCSLFGPGLAGWEGSLPVLRGRAPWINQVLPPPVPAQLSPNERRRAGLPTRLALTVSSEAVAASGLAAGDLTCVFASASGEGALVHDLLETLAGPEPRLSPTQFHNSVHNAVAGYWSIATQSEAPMTCLACNNWTFAFALLQAAATLRATGADILLCVYDAPVPWPLGAGRPTAFAFATALVLSPRAGAAGMAELDIRFAPEPIAADTPPRSNALAALVAGNAAARSLRLAESIARGAADQIVLALPDGHVVVDMMPC